MGFPVDRAIYLPYKHESDINLFCKKTQISLFSLYNPLWIGLDLHNIKGIEQLSIVQISDSEAAQARRKWQVEVEKRSWF